MADIQINAQNTETTINNVKPEAQISAPQKIKAAEESAILTKEAEPEKVPPAQEELENVVAVSKDGDTVQVKPETEEALELRGSFSVSEDNGSAADEIRDRMMEDFEEMKAESREAILAQREAQAQAAEAARENASDENTEASESGAVSAVSQSLTGISDAQLEKMYVDGSISRYDYDREMQSRESATEAAKANNSEASRQMGVINAESANEKQTSEAIESAYGGDSALPPQIAKDVLEAMDIGERAAQENAIPDYTVSSVQ